MYDPHLASHLSHGGVRRDHALNTAFQDLLLPPLNPSPFCDRNGSPLLTTTMTYLGLRKSITAPITEVQDYQNFLVSVLHLSLHGFHVLHALHAFHALHPLGKRGTPTKDWHSKATYQLDLPSRPS